MESVNNKRKSESLNESIGNNHNNNNNNSLILTNNVDSKANKKSKNDLSIVNHTNQHKELILGSSTSDRTSKLQNSIVQLTGHKGEVFSCKFNNSGTALASGSYDKSIFLWNVYGDCINYGVLNGHKGTILEVHWSTDDTQLVSCSSDKSIGIWDLNNNTLVKRIREHQLFINSCAVARRGPPYIASASDDSTSRLFDERVRGSIQQYKHKFPVTAVTFTDSSDQVITGSVDNVIRFWDLRNEDTPTMTFPDHSDTITSLSVSKDGSYLLSNSMDNTLRVWDIRSYAPSNRCIAMLIGAQHGFEKNLLKCSWSSNGELVSCGSSDGLVNIWDVNNKKLLYKLPGHTGSVNEVVFHPTDNIIASCSSDKSIYLGEIKSMDIYNYNEI